MPQAAILLKTGLSPSTAQAVTGFCDIGVTATGSNSQANSYAIVATNTFVSTAAANTGVRLQTSQSPGDGGFIYNGGASTLHIYPPSGGKINGGSTDAASDITTLKSALWMCISNDGLNFAVLKGA